MEFRDLYNFYNGKKVLVTGHTGFKGTWLCKILSMLGAKVYGYALEPNTSPNMYTLIRADEWVNSTIGDIRDFDRLKTCIDKIKPELVFHLAAQPIVRESYKFPRDTYEINVMGTVNVLESIRQNNCVRGFLNVTTDKVYENDENYNYPFTEDEKLDGYDPYSNSKSCSELVTHSFKKSFFLKNDFSAISTARAGNVIGGGDFSVDRIIPDCVRNAVQNENIIIRNPFSIRPYQHVLEPLYVYLIIMMKQVENKEYEGYYNVGPNEEDCITTGKLADYFVENWGGNISWINKGEINAPHEATYLKLDCSKLKSIFKWKPIWNVSNAVKYSVDWYKAWGLGMNCSDITEKQIREFFNGVMKDN